MSAVADCKITIRQDAQVDYWLFRAKLPDDEGGECYNA